MVIKVLPCDCEHEYQDRAYGKGNRVHNTMAGGKADYRCTVCGREKGSGRRITVNAPPVSS